MNISRNEVERYLDDVKAAVSSGRYQVSRRDKNLDLFVEYVFTENSCKEILLSLTVEDFSDAVANDHPQHPDEILYIFGKGVTLLPKFGSEVEKIPLYIKFNKLKDSYVIIVSFHKQEYPLIYKFT